MKLASGHTVTSHACVTSQESIKIREQYMPSQFNRFGLFIFTKYLVTGPVFHARDLDLFVQRQAIYISWDWSREVGSEARSEMLSTRFWLLSTRC